MTKKKQGGLYSLWKLYLSVWIKPRLPWMSVRLRKCIQIVSPSYRHGGCVAQCSSVLNAEQQHLFPKLAWKQNDQQERERKPSPKEFFLTVPKKNLNQATNKGTQTSYAFPKQLFVARFSHGRVFFNNNNNKTKNFIYHFSSLSALQIKRLQRQQGKMSLK